MSKLFILDAGHGGLNPQTKNYVTPGKRMVKDDVTFYEGVNNRILVDMIAEAMKVNRIDFVKLVDTWQDVSLSKRVQDANNLAKGRECVLISIHSDAAGNGKEWHTASGISSFTSVGKTKSDTFAKFLHDELWKELSTLTKNRGIRESDFYILKHTRMPAILLELGFHTHKSEVKLIQSNEWKTKVVKALIEGCKKINCI